MHLVKPRFAPLLARVSPRTGMDTSLKTRLFIFTLCIVDLHIYISTQRLTSRNQCTMYLKTSQSNRNILDTPFTPSSLSYRSEDRDRVTPLRYNTTGKAVVVWSSRHGP
jgi:hypothetical protein